MIIDTLLHLVGFILTPPLGHLVTQSFDRLTMFPFFSSFLTNLVSLIFFDFFFELFESLTGADKQLKLKLIRKTQSSLVALIS